MTDTLNDIASDILDDAAAAIAEPIETDAEKIARLEKELFDARDLAEKRSKWWEEERHKNRTLAKAFVPLISSAFYEMEPADVMDLIPMGDVTEEVVKEMDLDAVAQDVVDHYLDTDQIAEDVMSKLDHADIVSEVKSEAVQEVASVLIDALRSIG